VLPLCNVVVVTPQRGMGRYGGCQKVYAAEAETLRLSLSRISAKI